MPLRLDLGFDDCFCLLAMPLMLAKWRAKSRHTNQHYMLALLRLLAKRARVQGSALQPSDPPPFKTCALTTYQLLEHSRVVGWAEGFGAGWRCAVGRG